jgi:glyoxylase I family protein
VDVVQVAEAPASSGGVDVDPVFTGVSHVQLNVRDTAVSEPWYTALLGMTAFARGATAEGKYVALRHKPSRLTIVLSDADPADPGFGDRRMGMNHLALAVATADELERWAERLDGLGIPFVRTSDDGRGSPSLIIRDPDHIQLELIAPAPRPA